MSLKPSKDVQIILAKTDIPLASRLFKAALTANTDGRHPNTLQKIETDALQLVKDVCSVLIAKEQSK